MSDHPGPRPRAGAHGGDPGKYQLATRVDRPILDPGEKTLVQIFISGYGNIGAAKLHFAPPLELLDGRESRMRFDLKKTDAGFAFGGTSRILDEAGTVLSFTGGIAPSEKHEPTMFFDAVTPLPTGVPPIATEQVLGGHSVIDYTLAIRPDARPGTYPLFFTLTYFDGNEWQNSHHTITISIRNFYQRHETAIAWVAVVAAASSVVQAVAAVLSYRK